MGVALVAVACASSIAGTRAVLEFDRLAATAAVAPTTYSEQSASWSPDGRSVAFWRRLDHGRSAVYVVSDRGGVARRVSRGAYGSLPAWSPNGRWIAFSHRPLDGVAIVRSDGTGQRELAVFGLLPKWSPDGKTIAFEGDAADPFTTDGKSAHIYVVDPSQAAPRPLVPGENPDWSPDGSRLAFNFTPPGSTISVYVAQSDGHGARALTPGDSWRPQWSPAGSQIAFTRGTDRNAMIGLVYSDGTRARLLTRGSESDWSPNGRKLLLTRWNRAGTITSIWVINVDGSHLKRLTRGNDVGARWSPDGRRIVFRRGQILKERLWVMNADGTRQQRLTR
jgi:Tol biopolymer transport system component